MKMLKSRFTLVFVNFIVFSTFVGCGSEGVPEHFKDADGNPEDGFTKIEIETELKDYIIDLTVEDKSIYVDELVDVHLEIRASDVKSTVKKPDGSVSDNVLIVDLGAKYAKIKLNAKKFELMSEDKSDECVRIVPSGSNYVFQLKPSARGRHKISASVEFYEDDQCTKKYSEKSTASLSVNVKVNRMKELGDTAWSKFIIFWAALVALILGATLFLIRRKIKQKTGYEEKAESESN